MNISNNEKDPTHGRIVKLLTHKKLDRGMVLIEEQSRCVQKNQVHELVTTDQKNLTAHSRVDRVGFLGFAEINNNSVIERGDKFYIGKQLIGTVVGFDACHAPNHYNIIIEVPELISATDIELQVGHTITFAPNKVSSLSHLVTSHIRPIIIGFGYCGSQLHLPCIKKAFLNLNKSDNEKSFPMPTITVVDPCSETQMNAKYVNYIDFYNTITEIPQYNMENAVLHLCISPRNRPQILHDAIRLGIRRFILEKPVAINNEDLMVMKNLISKNNLDVLVVSNWSSSKLTEKLQQAIARFASQGIKMRKINIIQNKPRIQRSLTNYTHRNALEIEIPHMIVLSLLLAGKNVSVKESTVWDLCHNDQVRYGMGGADLTLQFDNGCMAQLNSNLVSPMRERRVEIEFENGYTLKGYFPSDSNSLHSFYYEYDNNGHIVYQSVIPDDTLTECFMQAYKYFYFNGNKPASDFNFHLLVSDLLIQARNKALINQYTVLEEI